MTRVLGSGGSAHVVLEPSHVSLSTRSLWSLQLIMLGSVALLVVDPVVPEWGRPGGHREPTDAPGGSSSSRLDQDIRP